MGEKERIRNREVLRTVGSVVLTEENVEAAGNWFLRVLRKLKEKVSKKKE